MYSGDETVYVKRVTWGNFIGERENRCSKNFAGENKAFVNTVR